MTKFSNTTISEIAKLADVSIATVSRVLSNKDIVKAATRKRVLDVIENLGYYADIPGNGGTSKNILMHVPHISNPFYISIIDGAQSAAARRGYNLLLSQSYRNDYRFSDFESVFNSQSLAGLILLHTLSDPDFFEKLSRYCPVVQCCEYNESAEASYVTIDDFSSAKTATNYLLSLGCEKIAMLNSTLNYKFARQREAGYIDSLKKAGKEVNSNWILHLPDSNFDMGLTNVTQLLEQQDMPDAFFAISDVLAAAVIKAAKRLGYRVPEDICVVGFDNTDISLMTEPSITTIAQPRFQMGYLACNLLIDKISNPSLPNKHLVLDTEFLIRESTKAKS